MSIRRVCASADLACCGDGAAALSRRESLRRRAEFTSTPSASVSQQYDSNVFSTAIDPDADFVTRATSDSSSNAAPRSGPHRPGTCRTWSASLITRDLSSVAARQRGTLALRYRSSLRTSWTADAEIWRTGTPSELNEATGLTVSRASAQRLLAHSSVNRHLSPVTSGTIDYTVTQDHLAGRTSATTHDAVAGVERHRSSRETVTFKYRFREFMFTPAVGRIDVCLDLARHDRRVVSGDDFSAATDVRGRTARYQHHTSRRSCRVTPLPEGSRPVGVLCAQPGHRDWVARSRGCSECSAPRSSGHSGRRCGRDLLRVFFAASWATRRADACVVAFDVTRPITHDVDRRSLDEQQSATRRSRSGNREYIDRPARGAGSFDRRSIFTLVVSPCDSHFRRPAVHLVVGLAIAAAVRLRRLVPRSSGFIVNGPGMPCRVRDRSGGCARHLGLEERRYQSNRSGAPGWKDFASAV